MSSRPPARRPASPRRYLVRRLAVGAILGIVLIAAVRVVGSVLGGDDGSAAADLPTTDTESELVADQEGEPTARDSDGADGADGVDGAADLEAAVAVASGAAGDGTESDATGTGAVGAVDGPPTLRGPPTPSDPARVLIVGDSDAGTFGPYLQQLLAETRVTDTTLDYKVSSGLARPDFFDWHAELERTVPAVDPDIVIVTFGGNDAQFLADRSGGVVVGQPRPDGDTAEWTAEYRRRVGAIVDLLDADGRTVIWVGIPNHVDPDVTFRMQLQDQAVKAELAERPDVQFVDTWTRFAGRSGGFAQFVIDPRDGVGTSVRASDGFHLNQAGAEILAIDIATVVFADLRARGAEI